MNMYVIMSHHDIIAMYWYTVLIIMLSKTEKIKICLLRYCTTYDVSTVIYNDKLFTLLGMTLLVKWI